MARVSFIPHDPIREEEREDERRERRSMKREVIDFVEQDERFGPKDPNDDEYASVEALAEFLMDSDEEQFDHWDLQCLNSRLGVPACTIRKTLEGYGLTLKLRAKERQIRGFKSNSHDRWSAYPSHGGGGGGSIMGMSD